LGKEHVYNAGETIVWAAALGPACEARAALVTRLLAPYGVVRSDIFRTVKSSKAKFKSEDATVTKFLMHPFLSGCTNWSRLEKGRGKKRAAGVPSASVATAVDLEQTRHERARGRPPSKRALLVAAHGRRGPARGLMRFCSGKKLRRVRVDRIYKKK
jgi:hypothetical protein